MIFFPFFFGTYFLLPLSDRQVYPVTKKKNNPIITKQLKKRKREKERKKNESNLTLLTLINQNIKCAKQRKL